MVLVVLWGFKAKNVSEKMKNGFCEREDGRKEEKFI